MRKMTVFKINEKNIKIFEKKIQKDLHDIVVSTIFATYLITIKFNKQFKT